MSVLVAGSLHLDVIVRAPHLPRQDETVRGEAVDYVPGGKGGNQAVAAARMGARVAMAGMVGSDAFGDRLLEALAVAGVDCGGVGRDAGASGMSVAIIEADGSYGAVIVSAANLRIDPAAIALPADARVLVLQNEVPEAVNLAAARAARGAGARTVLNAAPARAVAPELMALVDVLIVNRVEAADMLGLPEIGDAAEAARGLAALGPRAVIVTLGAGGLVLCEGGATRASPAHPVAVVSTHGAGDAFVGALAARLDAGDALAAAAAFGQAAAALHVSVPEGARGAVTPDAVRALARGASAQSR